MTHHIEHRSAPDPAVIEEFGHLHPVLARVLAARGIRQREELEHGLEGLLFPGRLLGMDAAVDLLVRMIRDQGKILIVGDFDADGATSSALAMRALKAMGAQHVDYIVPNRFEFGYGLTLEIVEHAIRVKGRPNLIVTVDNGIASCEGVATAQEHGVPVIVTDHHLPGEQLPAAAAIVNPNQPGDTFPSKNLAGVGVIFYVMCALRTRLRDEGWFEEIGRAAPNMALYLDLVALGTVADLVPLDHNNRILVAQGIARIREGRCCPGIDTLFRVAQRDRTRLVSSDLGFVAGPRLNAAGRIEDMSLGIECLLADDPTRAIGMAENLDKINKERREIEQDMQIQAEHILMQMSKEEDVQAPGLALFHPEWHQGVIGIVAARVKERTHRPVIAFAPSGVDGEIKGSARSIPGLHIRDTLDLISNRNPGLILRFGGHAMAAGLTLREEDFERFQTAFSETVGASVSEEDLKGVIVSDGPLSAHELTLSLADALRSVVPWGQTLPEPLFDDEFVILNKRVVGQKHLKLSVQHADGSAAIDAIAFNTDIEDCPARGQTARLAFHLDVNFFRGQKTLQLRVAQIGNHDTI